MRLIDADELKKKSFRYETNCGQKFLKTVLVKDIDNAPTVDAFPVVHGYWIGKGYDECSVCGRLELGRTNYCPYCGAKMNGESGV